MATITTTPESPLTTQLGDAASIDFIEQFNQRFTSLLELIGVNRKMPMSVGATIQFYRSEVTLDDKVVAPGEIIPLSEVKLTKGPTETLVWDKKRKAVTMEDIQLYGYERAVALTDEKLLGAIQRQIRGSFLAQLAKGTGAVSGAGLQEVLAKAWAAVVTTFDEDDVDVISFINPNDAAVYLADAAITTQTAFGMSYLENFLGNRVVFMHSSIPAGKIYTTASGNLVLAYAAVNSGALAQAFGFTSDSTGLIGVTHDADKQRLQAETITAYAMVLFAEVLSGIVIGTIAAPEAPPAG